MFKPKSVAAMSPPGYIINKTYHKVGRTLASFECVTPDGRLFSLSFPKKGDFLPITAQNILDMNVKLGGYVDVMPNGNVGIQVSYEPERWESLEDSLARCAVRLIENPTWWSS